MTDSKDGIKKPKRGGDRRGSKDRGDRRGLSGELFPGEEITHKEVGLEKDRRKDARRTGKKRRD